MCGRGRGWCPKPFLNRSAHEGYYKQIVSLLSLSPPCMISSVSLFLTFSFSGFFFNRVHICIILTSSLDKGLILLFVRSGVNRNFWLAKLLKNSDSLLIKIKQILLLKANLGRSRLTNLYTVEFAYCGF